jgi:hypothetical protein
MNELTEDPTERARMYVEKCKVALDDFIPVSQDSVVKAKNIKRVSDSIDRYLKDARYYLENKKPTTALASIAYAEGLMDALTFLELAKSNSSK